MTTIGDIKRLIRRRSLIFVLSAIPVFIGAVVIAFVLPPIYVAKSTILIESQQIPEEYVKSTVTGYIEERLQTITQRILSRSNLLNIINQFDLYPELRKKYATEIVIDKMRKDINLETIQAQEGRQSSTIAFTLSYEGERPPVVQRVANVLASLYLEENLKKRENQATRTTEFLQQELNDLREQIGGYANQLSEFKKIHMGELPEHSAVNMQAIEQLNRDFDQLSLQISMLQERKVYLEGQLASLESGASGGGKGEFTASPNDRIESLQLALINLKSSLSEKHPDVIKLQKEIKELEAHARGETGAGEKEKRLTGLQEQLATMSTSLGSKHPDVVKLSKEIDVLSRELQASGKEVTTAVFSSQKEERPAYVSLRTQLDTTILEIEAYLKEKNEIKEKIALYQQRIEKTPMIEKEYYGIIGDYTNAKEKYNEIMSKLLEARVARGMEETQHGERFVIIESAHTPEAPSKPNRIRIIVMGLFLAIGLGGGLTLLQENFDHSIKTPHEIGALTPLPLLAAIPLIVTDAEVTRRRLRATLFTVLTSGGLIMALLVVHFFYMPLDIVWLNVQRTLMIQF